MSDWPVMTLGEICAEGGGFIRTGPFGSQLHQSDYVDDPDGIPVVMPKDMAHGRIDLSTIARISADTADRLSQHLLAAGDIALSRRGDVGRSAWIGEEDLPVLCGTGSMRVHPGRLCSVDADYLRYFFRSRLAIDYLEGQAVGATMPNLNAGIVTGMPVPVLPMNRQRFAADVLRSIDDLIGKNRRRVEVLEEMARAIYREWCVRFRYPGHEDVPLVDSPLGPIPDGWHVAPLFDVADVGFGFSFKSKRFADRGPFPVVRIRDVPKGTTETFSDEDPGERYRVVDGDVLIGMDGDFHLRQWSGGLAWLNQRVARLRPHAGLSARHLLLAIDAPIREWNATISGTTVAHLGKRHLEQVQIVIPEDSILKRSTDFFDDVWQQVVALTQAARRLASMRDLLLPKLVTGQFDVSRLDLDALTEAATA